MFVLGRLYVCNRSLPINDKPREENNLPSAVLSTEHIELAVHVDGLNYMFSKSSEILRLSPPWKKAGWFVSMDQFEVACYTGGSFMILSCHPYAACFLIVSPKII